jgi:transposase InsO family protein
LRALKTETAAEACENLFEIFTTIGAPVLLHSGNGREFNNRQLLEMLAEFWPETKIVRGKPRHSQSQGAVERANREVQDMLKHEMRLRNTTQWSKLLKFVQFKKNCIHHEGIGRKPYEALFHQPPKMGLNGHLGDRLSPAELREIDTEEDLERIMHSLHIEDQVNLLPSNELLQRLE